MERERWRKRKGRSVRETHLPRTLICVSVFEHYALSFYILSTFMEMYRSLIYENTKKKKEKIF